MNDSGAHTALERLSRSDDLERVRKVRAQIERAQRRRRRRATLTLRDGTTRTGWLLGGAAVLHLESNCGFGVVCIVTEAGEFETLPYRDIEACEPADVSDPDPSCALRATLAAYLERFERHEGERITERT